MNRRAPWLVAFAIFYLCAVALNMTLWLLHVPWGWFLLSDVPVAVAVFRAR